MAIFQTTSELTLDRLESVDALRGIAAIYILLYHMALVPQPNLPVPQWASSFILTGGTGVTAFFLISSFCLCSSMQLHKQETRVTTGFYLRRFFRIAPLFYIWIVITLIRDRFWFGVTHSWTDILLNAFFVFNFIPGKQEGFVWASWILSVQMIFYLLFPFIYRYINDLSKSLVFFFITLLTGSAYDVFVSYLPVSDSQRASFLQFGFLHHLPVFALGIVAFFLYKKFIQGKNLAFSCGVAMTAAAVFGYTALLSGRLKILLDGLYWQGIIYGLLLLGLLAAPSGMFVNRMTRFYGKISYSVYLNHPTLVFALVPLYSIIYRIQMSTTLKYGVCLVLTLSILTVISYFTHRLIEEPGMRLGKLFIKKIATQ